MSALRNVIRSSALRNPTTIPGIRASTPPSDPSWARMVSTRLPPVDRPSWARKAVSVAERFARIAGRSAANARACSSSGGTSSASSTATNRMSPTYTMTTARTRGTPRRSSIATGPWIAAPITSASSPMTRTSRTR
jgi:hypothetical protein